MRSLLRREGIHPFFFTSISGTLVSVLIACFSSIFQHTARFICLIKASYFYYLIKRKALKAKWVKKRLWGKTYLIPRETWVILKQWRANLNKESIGKKWSTSSSSSSQNGRTNPISLFLNMLILCRYFSLEWNKTY